MANRRGLAADPYKRPLTLAAAGAVLVVLFFLLRFLAESGIASIGIGVVGVVGGLLLITGSLLALRRYRQT